MTRRRSAALDARGRSASRELLTIAGVVLLACGSAGIPPEPPPTGPTTEAVVGENGGTVAVERGPRLTIPAGALDTPTTIRIRTLPAADGSRSEYRFEPDGTVFARPVTVELPVAPGTTAASVYWADGDGAFEPIGGAVVGDVARALVTHFSGGYAGPASPIRTVTGSSIVTNLTNDRIYNDPVDISGRTIAAWVARAGGGYDRFPGTGYADGTFRVPDVPVGPYLLQVGKQYVLTRVDVVDMGQLAPGRRGLVEVDPTAAIIVEYGLSGLEPWGTSITMPQGFGERLDVFSVEANSWFWSAQGNVDPGATTLTSRVNLLGTTKKVPVYALDAAMGDRLIVAQQSVATSSNGLPYRAMSRVYESGPVSAVAGTTLPLEGAFTQVAQDVELSLDWDFASYDALLADANPNAVLDNGLADGDLFTNRFRVVGQPGGMKYGTYDLISKPEFLALPVPASTGSLSSGRMTFGTPLSGTWGAHWIASADRFVPVQMGDIHGYFQVSVRSMAEVGASAVQLPGPKFGLPRNPKIGGQDLFTARAGVGLTPTLSWEEPVPGPADGYTIMIVQLVGTGNPPWRYVAFVHTAETSIELPPGILSVGSRYLAIIRGYQRGLRVEAPLRIDLPLEQGIQVTEAFEP